MSTRPHTYKAEETATSKHHFLTTGAAEQSCLTQSSAGAICIGISEDDLVNGEGASVVDDDGDVAFLLVSEACDEGAELKSNASGHGINDESNATPENQWIGAIALGAATAANDVIRVRKCGYWKYA